MNQWTVRVWLSRRFARVESWAGLMADRLEGLERQAEVPIDLPPEVALAALREAEARRKEME